MNSKYGEFSVDNENSVELTDVRATIKIDWKGYNIYYI